MSAEIQQLRPLTEVSSLTEKYRPPGRAKNTDYRSREYLTHDEVMAMIKAVRKHNKERAHRDEAILLLGYRHGLRAKELCELKWDQFNQADQTLYVKRVKNGRHSTHPMETDELRLVNKLRAKVQGRYVFISRRGTPISYNRLRSMARIAAEQAGIEFPVHPHMLRHACGYALVNKGVDLRVIQQWMGHANMQNTVRYTELDASRFEGLWD